jgi:predicted nucleic acid-binding protein
VIPAPFKVVLDACVIFPAAVRDTLLRAAEAELYQPYWTDEILNEAIRNMVAGQRITATQGQTLLDALRGTFPEAMIADYQDLVPTMPNNPKDHHVAAAAVKCGAEVIVTANIDDFKVLPTNIEAQTPDDFLCHLFDLAPREMVKLLQQQADALKRPKLTLAGLLQNLEPLAPGFVEMVRDHVGVVSTANHD